ncbi:hypothetical protein CKO25_04945 [Thiocapsa imhoffii]|uniref:DUF2878 domain-containing protein n=1 Tax=Thiocapsa imhoffii TaxID=382777 RepID=A0A9X1B7S7_9GAMM|nr:hypothetical protein [Thiocapsa imhoffii]
MPRIILNLVAFQIGWLACVLGGAHQQPWLGVVVVALVVAYHLKQCVAPGRELRLLLIMGVMGAVWDGMLVRFGFLDYPSGLFVAWLAPVWIIAMWVGFATTLNVSLAWLKGRWGLAVVLGGLAGPLAYYAGYRLGGVYFPDLFVAMVVLAGGWSFLMPVSLWFAQRFDGTMRAAAMPSDSQSLRGSHTGV